MAIDTAPDEAHALRVGLLDAINREIQRRHDTGSFSVPAFLPHPNGALISTRDATSEQWQQTYDACVPAWLGQIEELADTIILLTLARSLIADRIDAEARA